MRMRCTPWQTIWCVPSGAGDVAHDVGDRADPVQIVRPGSSISASRCSTMPIGRCSRTACWAAAIDFGRPMVIGATMPGNSTVLRTGRMNDERPRGSGTMSTHQAVRSGAPGLGASFGSAEEVHGAISSGRLARPNTRQPFAAKRLTA